MRQQVRGATAVPGAASSSRLAQERTQRGTDEELATFSDVTFEDVQGRDLSGSGEGVATPVTEQHRETADDEDEWDDDFADKFEDATAELRIARGEVPGWLDYESLKAINPRLVYCSITGFGQTGPRAQQVAYDFLIQAMGGLMSITGEEDGKPGGGPQKIGVPMVDLSTGLYAVIGILAAIARRETTGQGDFVDIGMLDVQTSLLANQAMNHLLTGQTPRRYGNGHPNIMPQQVFKCRDGQMVLAVGNDGQFARLCAALGDTEMATDAELAQNRGRVARRDWLLARLADHFAIYERSVLLALLDAADVPAGPINTIPEVFAEDQVKAREMVGHLPHPEAGSVPQVFSPIKFENAAFRPDIAPPLLGADTESVLEALGYEPARIETLRKSGAI